MLLVSAFISDARCENPVRMFSKFANQSKKYEYTYISSRMIKFCAGDVVKEIPASKLKLIEMIKTSSGCDKMMKEAVSNAVNSNDLELISTQDTEKKRSDFYARWDEKKNVFTKLLLMKYGDFSHCNVQLLYIVGDLTPEDVSSLFDSMLD